MFLFLEIFIIIIIIQNITVGKKFKAKLVGDRIILKRTKPDLKLAKKMFEAVDANREYLREWLEWVDETKSHEDSMKTFEEREPRVQEGKTIQYAIYLGKELIGTIALFDIDENNKTGEIGYWLSKEHASKGLTTEALRILEYEAFENLGINRIQIKCDVGNKASARVAEKAGYVFEGELRDDSYSPYFKEFRNTLLFSKIKSEWKQK